jgi:apolipoprotein D and lipocalin family protein
MKNLFLISALSFFTGCSTKSESPLKTAEHVEIPKFMGSWYVIANIPTFLEKGAHNAVETYTWNEKEERIDVNFTFNDGSFEGKKKSLPQKAFVHNKKTGAEWKIQFFWPLKFSYLILDVAPDYSHTIIGVPDRGHVWIMARTPKMEESVYASLVKKVRDMNFDVSKIEKVPQQPR